MILNAMLLGEATNVKSVFGNFFVGGARSGERTRPACSIRRLAERAKVRGRFHCPFLRASVFAARRRKRHARRMRSPKRVFARGGGEAFAPRPEEFAGCGEDQLAVVEIYRSDMSVSSPDTLSLEQVSQSCHPVCSLVSLPRYLLDNIS